MSVSSLSPRENYLGNGTQDTYDFGFKIDSESELVVFRQNVDGDVAQLANPVDFTVSGVGETDGGTITLVAGDLATDWKLSIRKALPISQTIPLRNNRYFSADIHEDALDKLTWIAHQLQDQLDRSLKMPDTIPSGDFNPTLPVPEGNRMLMFNEDGTGLARGPTPQELSDAAAAVSGSLQAAEDAEAAAAAAQVSASAAAASAIAAAASDSSAADSAAAAAQSAIDAANAAIGVTSVFGRNGDITAQAGDYTKAQVGLGNVDNTSDAAKPVSTLQQAAIDDAMAEAVAAQDVIDLHMAETDDAHDASAISYDNATSGLTADDVQAAIDEIAALAGSGGGGGGSQQWIEDDGSPLPFTENGMQGYTFEKSQGQKLKTIVKVPAGYQAGNQIIMKLPGYSSATADTLLLQTVATLIRTGTDAVTSTANQRTSTNAALTPPGANVPVSFEMDLTSAIGQINAVAVSPGDLIKVELQRGTDTQTVDLKALVFASEVSFG